MNQKITGLLFLSICIVLAILLLTKMISSTTSGGIFAVALILLGVALKRFTN